MPNDGSLIPPAARFHVTLRQLFECIAWLSLAMGTIAAAVDYFRGPPEPSSSRIGQFIEATIPFAAVLLPIVAVGLAFGAIFGHRLRCITLTFLALHVGIALLGLLMLSFF